MDLSFDIHRRSQKIRQSTDMAAFRLTNEEQLLKSLNSGFGRKGPLRAQLRDFLKSKLKVKPMNENLKPMVIS